MKIQIISIIILLSFFSCNKEEEEEYKTPEISIVLEELSSIEDYKLFEESYQYLSEDQIKELLIIFQYKGDHNKITDFYSDEIIAYLFDNIISR